MKTLLIFIFITLFCILFYIYLYFNVLEIKRYEYFIRLLDFDKGKKFELYRSKYGDVINNIDELNRNLSLLRSEIFNESLFDNDANFKLATKFNILSGDEGFYKKLETFRLRVL